MGKCIKCDEEMTQEDVDNDNLDFDLDAGISLIIHKRCPDKK
jgi:hypothetical protein